MRICVDIPDHILRKVLAAYGVTAGPSHDDLVEAWRRHVARPCSGG